MSENEILKLIHNYFPNKDNKHILARGDDCAVLELDKQSSHIVITTDIFVENSHFKSSYFSPKAIGYKALAVNISDIYSMGASPFSAQLALSFPKNYSKNHLEEIISSMAELSKEHDILLSGGDLSRTDVLYLSITLLGLKDKEVKLYRNQGKISDIVYIVGDIGLSRLALTLLEEIKLSVKEIEEKYPLALNAHFYPELHKESSMQIADFAKKHQNYAFSLMDLSDGLAKDLPRLVENYGIKLCLDKKTLNKELLAYFNNDTQKALEFAIAGGEDYALLGTCPKELWNNFQSTCPKAKQIGTIVENKGIFLNAKEIKLKGFDHFA